MAERARSTLVELNVEPDALDEFDLRDVSEAAPADQDKRFLWGTLKSVLTTAFDLLYMSLTTPVLGGNMLTKGNQVVLDTAGDVEVGRLGIIQTDDGVYLARTLAGSFVDTDGAFVATDGQAHIYGGVVHLVSGKHGETRPKQVQISANGNLVYVDQPAAGWGPVIDTDPGVYPLTGGTGTSGWVEMTGLDFALPVTVEAGDPIDFAISLYVVADSAHNGFVDMAVTTEGGTPAASDDSRAVGAGHAGFIPFAFRLLAPVQYTSGTVLTVYIRSRGGSHTQWTVSADGSSFAHEGSMSGPATGGTVPTTFMELTDTPADYAGQALRPVRVNDAGLGNGDGIEYHDKTFAEMLHQGDTVDATAAPNFSGWQANDDAQQSVVLTHTAGTITPVAPTAASSFKVLIPSSSSVFDLQNFTVLDSGNAPGAVANRTAAVWYWNGVAYWAWGPSA